MLGTLILDLLAIAGLAAIVFGCWQIYQPAAYILVGCAFVFVACVIGKG